MLLEIMGYAEEEKNKDNELENMKIKSDKKKLSRRATSEPRFSRNQSMAV